MSRILAAALVTSLLVMPAFAIDLFPTSFAAFHATGGVVADSSHWIMEENPAAVAKRVADFPAK